MTYWQERLKQQQDTLYDKTLAQTQAQLRKQYTEALKKTLQDTERLYNTLAAGGEIKVNDLYRYNRYFELKNNLNQQLKALGAREIEITNAQMLRMYDATQKLVGSTFDKAFAPLDATRAQSVLDSVWCADGKHWSARVWDNKQALQERIEKGLIDCVARGVPKDELIKVLKADFGVGFSNADRLVRTEL